MYLEMGTGIDNILKFFRVDFIWKVLSASPTKQPNSKFGIFGSFRIQF